MLNSEFQYTNFGGLQPKPFHRLAFIKISLEWMPLFSQQRVIFVVHNAHKMITALGAVFLVQTAL